jgi:hypothetical protein
MTRAEQTRLIGITNKILSTELENLPDDSFWRDKKGLRISTENLKFIEPFIHASRKVVYTIGTVRHECEEFHFGTAIFTRGNDSYIVINGDEMKFKVDFKEMIESVLLCGAAFKDYKG